MSLFPSDFKPEKPKTPGATNTRGSKPTPIKEKALPQSTQPDRDYATCAEMATEFLNAFGYRKSKVLFGILPAKDSGKPKLKDYTRYATPQAVLEELWDYNQLGYDVFFMPNRGTGAELSDITECPSMFIDWDNADQAPPRLDPQPTIVVNTSPGKFHAYWLLDSPIMPTAWKDAQKQLIERYGSDKLIHNPNRWMRLPGFYHNASGKLVTYKELSGDTFDVSQVLGGGQPTNNTPNEMPRVLGELTTDEREVFMDIASAPRGQGAVEFCKAGSKAARKRIPRDRALQVAEMASEQRGTPWHEHSDSFNNGYTNGLMTTSDGKPRKLTPLETRESVERFMAGKVRFNDLTEKREWEGGELSRFSNLYLQYREVTGHEITKELFIDLSEEIAYRYKYNPIQDQILKWVEQYGDSGKHLLDSLATRYIGCETAIENIQARKAFRRLLMRIFHPGCKADNISTIFTEAQGYGKSTLIKAIAMQDIAETAYYNRAKVQADRDVIIAQHHCVVSCFEELAALFRTTDKESLKADLTETHDSHRGMYARDDEAVTRGRRYVFWAATNKPIPPDETGSRRWEVFTPVNKADVQGFLRDRAQIYAAIYLENEAYLQGKNVNFLPKEDEWHWYNAESESELQQRNAQFTSVDSFTEDVLDAAAAAMELSDKGDRFTATMLCEALRNQGRGHDNMSTAKPEMHRAKAILKANGFTCKETDKIKVGGKWKSGTSYTAPDGFRDVVKGDDTDEAPVEQPHKFKVGDLVYNRDGVACVVEALAATEPLTWIPLYDLSHPDCEDTIRLRETELNLVNVKEFL